MRAPTIVKTFNPVELMYFHKYPINYYNCTERVNHGARHRRSATFPYFFFFFLSFVVHIPCLQADSHMGVHAVHVLCCTKHGRRTPPYIITSYLYNTNIIPEP